MQHLQCIVICMHVQPVNTSIKGTSTDQEPVNFARMDCCPHCLCHVVLRAMLQNYLLCGIKEVIGQMLPSYLMMVQCVREGREQHA